MCDCPDRERLLLEKEADTGRILGLLSIVERQDKENAKLVKDLAAERTERTRLADMLNAVEGSLERCWPGE